MFSIATELFVADPLHLTIPPQGLPNGDAATLQHAFPGLPPFPGVGEYFFYLA